MWLEYQPDWHLLSNGWIMLGFVSALASTYILDWYLRNGFIEDEREGRARARGSETQTEQRWELSVDGTQLRDFEKPSPEPFDTDSESTSSENGEDSIPIPFA